MGLIDEVKKKKEFSQLPDSVVERALEISGKDVKRTRALLRKYFGVFLTNKVLKASGEDVLKSHISTKKRDYEEFYKRIFGVVGMTGSVIDLGCGVNGFSYGFLREIFGDVEYFGIEAVGQLVDATNKFFDSNNLGEICNYVWGDVFDLRLVQEVLKKADKPRVVFIFQLIDALESFERDFSKKFLKEVAKESEFIVISLPTRSLSGKKGFAVKRKWLVDFLKENFKIVEDFEMFGERVVVVRTGNGLS